MLLFREFTVRSDAVRAAGLRMCAVPRGNAHPKGPTRARWSTRQADPLVRLRTGATTSSGPVQHGKGSVILVGREACGCGGRPWRACPWAPLHQPTRLQMVGPAGHERGLLGVDCPEEAGLSAAPARADLAARRRRTGRRGRWGREWRRTTRAGPSGLGVVLSGRGICGVNAVQRLLIALSQCPRGPEALREMHGIHLLCQKPDRVSGIWR